MKLNFLANAILLLFIVSYLFSCKDSRTKPQVKTETAVPDNEYIEMGKNLAAETQSVLAKNLTNAISKGGAEYAVEFCNTKAILLTDSMTHVLNAGIKRVTDRPRNPANLANERELEYLISAKDKLQRGEKPEPILSESNGKRVGLYPIITNNMCLQCHGKKDIDINAATYEKIKKLYPEDMAVGYGANELRGLWVVDIIKK